MKKLIIFLCIINLIGLNGCATKLGDKSAKTVATGSVAGATAKNVNPILQRCKQPLGTLAIVEDYDQVVEAFAIPMGNYPGYSGRRSTVPVLRLLAQQSNCFNVVDRSAGLRTMQTERYLSETGELRKNSNFQSGQMVAADYTMSPHVEFAGKSAGGVGMMAGGFVPVFGPLIGLALSSISKNDAQCVLTMIDNRSGIQVAAAEGSSSSMDIGGLFGLLGSGGGGGLGGFSRTPEGKLVVASMTDAFNNLIIATRNYIPQQASNPKGMGTGGKLQVN